MVALIKLLIIPRERREIIEPTLSKFAPITWEPTLLIADATAVSVAVLATVLTVVLVNRSVGVSATRRIVHPLRLRNIGEFL